MVENHVVALDDTVEAAVQLPDLFSAMNNDCRFQLTGIEAPGPNLCIAKEMSDASQY